MSDEERAALERRAKIREDWQARLELVHLRARLGELEIIRTSRAFVLVKEPDPRHPGLTITKAYPTDPTLPEKERIDALVDVMREDRPWPPQPILSRWKRPPEPPGSEFLPLRLVER